MSTMMVHISFVFAFINIIISIIITILIITYASSTPSNINHRNLQTKLPVFLLVCTTIDGEKMRRVVNGKLITKGEWPSLVSLHFLRPHPFTANTYIQHVCGGTLIDPLWVITAAHCVSESTYPGLSDIGNWQVVLGEHNQYIKDNGEQIRTIEQVYVYPEYDLAGTNSVHHDIALLRLSEPVNESSEVSVIDMNEIELGHVDNDTEMMCTVGGWGQLLSSKIPLKLNVCYFVMGGSIGGGCWGGFVVVRNGIIQFMSHCCMWVDSIINEVFL